MQKIAAEIQILLKSAHRLSNVYTIYTGRQATFSRVAFLPVSDIIEIKQGRLESCIWLASALRCPDICMEENPLVSFWITGVSLDLQGNHHE